MHTDSGDFAFGSNADGRRTANKVSEGQKRLSHTVS